MQLFVEVPDDLPAIHPQTVIEARGKMSIEYAAQLAKRTPSNWAAWEAGALPVDPAAFHLFLTRRPNAGEMWTAKSSARMLIRCTRTAGTVKARLAPSSQEKYPLSTLDVGMSLYVPQHLCSRGAISVVARDRAISLGMKFATLHRRDLEAYEVARIA